MAVKISRSGGKFNGSHTTLTTTAAVIAEIAHDCDTVYKISIGIIESGLRPAGGQKRIKITQDGHHLLVKVRGNITEQQLYVYSKNVAETVSYVAEKAKAAGFLVKLPDKP